MIDPQPSQFGEIFLYIIVGIVFIAGGLFTSWILRPSRPNHEKLTTYECGEDPSGSAWGQFNIRFYIVAILFILFEVEIIFLFPWAVVFGDAEKIQATSGLWGYFTLVEMFVFLSVLALGLAFAWAKGFLDWEKPEAKRPKADFTVSQVLYDKINKKYN